MKLGLNRYTSSGSTTSATTMLISMIMTSSRPISARNLRPDKKYHGKILNNTIVAVKNMALPVVATASRMESP